MGISGVVNDLAPDLRFDSKLHCVERVEVFNFNDETGEVICLANEALTESKMQNLMAEGIKSIKILYIDMVNFGDQIRNTLLLDKTPTTEDALLKIFER